MNIALDANTILSLLMMIMIVQLALNIILLNMVRSLRASFKDFREVSLVEALSDYVKRTEFQSALDAVRKEIGLWK